MTILTIEDALEPYFSSEFDILHESPSDYNPYVWDVPDNTTDRYINGHYDSISHLTAIHKISHMITMIVGGVCSSTLLYLVLYHCKGPLEQYRKMLLLCSVSDLGFWLLENTVSVKTKVNDGYLFARLEGIAKFASYDIQAVFTALYCMQLTMMVTILPSQYYYRYWFVTRSEALSACQTFGLYCISFFFAFPLLCVAYPAFRYSGLARPGFNYGALWYEEQPFPPLVIADFTSVYAQRYLFYCITIFVASYGVSLMLAVKTLRLLAENQDVYSEKTKRMQRQLTSTLALQTLMPLLISFGPVVTVCIGCFSRMDTGIMSLVVLWFNPWIPVLNPMLTIWVIKPFRKVVFRWAYIRVGVISSGEFSSMQKNNHMSTTNNRGAITNLEKDAV